MSSGRTHSTASILLATVATPFSVYHWGGDGFLVGLGVLSNLLLTPDLDLIDTSGNYSMHVLRVGVGRGCLGEFVANLWRVFWWPYARLLPHRSIWSHFPVLGTILRVIYVGWFPLLVYFYFFQVIPNLTWFPPWFLGLTLADTLHVLMDF